MIKRLGLSAILLSSVFAAAPALAGDLTIGTPQPNYGNCYPFSCAASDGATTFQQIYNGAAFGGAIRINAATFTEAFTNDNNAIDSASYDVSFYLSDKTTATLSDSISGNEASLLADWGTFTFGGTLSGNSLTLAGQSFVYDPTQGSLLMNIKIHDVTNTVGYQTFFVDDAGTDSIARVFGDDQNTYGPFNQALVTTFDTSGVPEPASWAMMVGGFGLVGGAMRRRAAKIAFA
jgi:hypothetical protein